MIKNELKLIQTFEQIKDKKFEVNKSENKF